MKKNGLSYGNKNERNLGMEKGAEISLHMDMEAGKQKSGCSRIGSAHKIFPLFISLNRKNNPQSTGVCEPFCPDTFS